MVPPAVVPDVGEMPVTVGGQGTGVLNRYAEITVTQSALDNVLLNR